MDITKQLSKLNDSHENMPNIMMKINEEYENIEKKKHIFEIIDIVYKLKNLVPVLLKEDIKIIRLTKRIRGDGFGIELSARRKKEDTSINVTGHDEKTFPWFESLMSIYMNVVLNCKLTEEFKDNNNSQKYDINLEEEIDPQIYKVLLSKEIQVILDYNNLHLKLEKNISKKEIKKTKKI